MKLDMASAPPGVALTMGAVLFCVAGALEPFAVNGMREEEVVARASRFCR